MFKIDTDFYNENISPTVTRVISLCFFEARFFKAGVNPDFEKKTFFFDTNGTTKLYGEARTVIFKIDTDRLGADYVIYWENASEMNDPQLDFRNY